MAIFKTRHTRWIICDCCHGNGRVENPAFSNGFTSSEWDEMAHDWDACGEINGQDRYLSGAYDLACDECCGTGKVRQPDFQAMPRNERREYVKFLREQREESEFNRMCALERMMGA